MIINIFVMVIETKMTSIHVFSKLFTYLTFIYSPELKTQVCCYTPVFYCLVSFCLFIKESIHIFSHINFSRITVSSSTILDIKHLLGENDSSLFNWRVMPFTKRDNCHIVKIHWQLLQNHRINFNQFLQRTPLGKGNSVSV